jgi:oxygen-independent coproporphyrinogen-3 oxidase
VSGLGVATRPPEPVAAPGGSVLAEVAPRDGPVGLYVHVPYCVARCHYCSFPTAPLRPGAMTPYLDALYREIDLVARAPWADALRVETIFLGGGTPSLLAPAQLGGILDRLRDRFRLLADVEITVECNPESVDRARLEAYRGAGVTRASIGVQSLDDTILARLGRLHDAARARRAFDAARAAGLDQVSVDLMYGLPGLDADGWRRTVDAALDWRPDHLSAYGLTLDAGSLWGSRGVAGLPPEETVVEQYWTLARSAAAAGYEHYEISNYARPGCRSRHNQLYWEHREYLAFGPGACGFLGDVRYANVRSTDRYLALLEGDTLPIGEHERLTARQWSGERLWLGLRTRDGVPADWLHERAVLDRRLRTRLDEWVRHGLLAIEGDRAHLTEAGFLLSDALFVELL